MAAEHESTVVVASVRNAFEAETIAAALHERGIDARVFDAATTMAWGMPMGESGGVKVVVLEHELERARRALDDVRLESASIDWDAVDVGEDPSARRLGQVSRSRRWAWTVMLLLVPAGLMVMSIGVNRSDATLKILGGVLLAMAVAMGASQMTQEEGE
jgi:hypothetical protein